MTREPDQFAMLWFAIINRDRKAFPYPDVVIPERTPNRHLNFGSGIHRCVGVHLSRVETAIAISELLRRIPDFKLDPTKKPVYGQGQVQGFSSVPIVFPTSKTAGHPQN